MEQGIPGGGQQAETLKPPMAGKAGPGRGLLLHRADANTRQAAKLRQKQTKNDLTVAAALLRQSVRLYQDAHHNREAAQAALQLGEILFILSQYPQAIDSFNSVLALAGADRELRCRALSRIARVYANTGNSDLAAPYSKQALAEGQGLSPGVEAEVLQARGEVLLNSGGPQAAEHLLRARDLFAQARDNDGEALAILQLAYIRFLENQAEGLRLAGQALQLWSSSGNSYGVAQARSALGGFAAATDRFETVQCNHEEALKRFRTIGDRDSEAVALNWIGYMNRERGDSETSFTNYRKARKILDTIDDRLAKVENITGMAKTLTVQHKYEQALPLYNEKLRLAEQTHNPKQAASAQADIGGVYELQQDYTQAEIFYRRALEAYRRLDAHYGIGDLLIRLASLQRAQGKYAEAIETLQGARSEKLKSNQYQDIARIEYELATIHLRLHRLAEARAAIEETIKIIEAQGLRIRNFDSRAAYFASVHRYFALYVQALMLLHRQDPEQGYMRMAFEASENSKFRSLLDLLEVSTQVLPCDELLRKQSREPENGQVAAPLKAPHGLTLSEIQAEIEKDDRVLEYWLGEDRSYLWVVDHEQIVVHELPPAEEIRKLATAFRETLTAQQPQSGETLKQYNTRVHRADRTYPALARQLGGILLPPAALGQAKRILIVPDGLLQYIPFSALVASQAESEFLIQRHELVTLPSVSALATLRKISRPPPTRTAIVMAYPPNNHELPGSPAEAEAIQKIFGQENATVEFNGSRSFVLHGGLLSYRYVHFAVHGIIDALHPEMSRLIVALPSRNGREPDGSLQLGDIYQLTARLSADLVVLSACESALGKGMKSEGIIGLPRGFLYAGAKSVIASLWKVDDKATKELMEDVYAGLQQGQSPSSALRAAQWKMSRTKQRSAPFFWAGFILQGDYK